MASVDPRLMRLLIQYGRRYGVDPYAAAAVSIMEGGGRFGAVGDSGTSYGPFQLHVGGALPSNRGARWANSPAGIEYAIRNMAASGARGLHGAQAISAIVRGFERPAQPGPEIQGAISRYASLRGMRPGPAPGGGRTDAGYGPVGQPPGRSSLAALLSFLHQQQPVTPPQPLQPLSGAPSPYDAFTQAMGSASSATPQNALQGLMQPTTATGRSVSDVTDSLGALRRRLQGLS